MPDLVFATKKSSKKSLDRHQRRVSQYKRHHNNKEGEFGDFIKQVYTQEEQDTKELKKKFLETKAKKTKKDKPEKNNKVRQKHCMARWIFMRISVWLIAITASGGFLHVLRNR